MEAPDINWLDSARAAALRTPVVAARAVETCGENALAALAADACPAALELEADVAEAAPLALGALRAELMAEADWAMDWEAAALMLWLLSARAVVWLITEALAALLLEGARLVLVPAALAVLCVVALWAEAL